jgi:TolB-like protein/tetratricopeptide (TPR) repeat protein
MRPHAIDRRLRLSDRISFRVGFPSFFLWRPGDTLPPGNERNLDLRYYFEDCLLDTDRRELRRKSSLVAVEPQVFDLLVHLMRHRDRVVTKDDLLAAVWHGRIVSESALANRINAARGAIGAAGNQQRLIRTLPRRGVRFVGAVREDTGDATVRPSDLASSTSEKPSIAVLPFLNLGGNADTDYLVDGIVEDIITALSRNRGFFVIARNSSFAYKGGSVDVKQVARELGVRYALEGSIRVLGDRMRVTAQLIEGVSSRHLWADKFDHTSGDPFELQDRLVERVVGAIAPQLEKAEMDRVKRDLTSNPAAYNFYLRGLASWNRWSQEDNANALTLFYTAIEKDPEFARAYGLAASCYQFAKANGWQSDFDRDEISRLTEHAVALGSDDAVALCWGGHVRAFFFKEVERALLLIDRALELDVNLAAAWQRSGWVRGYAGDHEGAIRSLERAMRLNPLDPRVFLTQSAMAFAHFIAGRDQDASDWAAMAGRVKPNWMPALRVAIAANAMLGRTAEARDCLQAYELVEPDVNIRKICEHYPFQRAQDKQRLIEALRRAGVREA